MTLMPLVDTTPLLATVNVKVTQSPKLGLLLSKVWVSSKSVVTGKSFASSNRPSLEGTFPPATLKSLSLTSAKVFGATNASP